MNKFPIRQVRQDVPRGLDGNGLEGKYNLGNMFVVRTKSPYACETHALPSPVQNPQQRTETSVQRGWDDFLQDSYLGPAIIDSICNEDMSDDIEEALCSRAFK